MNTRSNLFTNELTNDTAVFSAPLEAVKKGRLEISSSVSNFDLTADSTTGDLFHAQFIGLIPDVINRLAFDGHFYGAVAGGIQLETPDYKDAADRYDIIVNSGVSHLTIRTQA
jgi:hypothetical protein